MKGARSSTSRTPARRLTSTHGIAPPTAASGHALSSSESGRGATPTPPRLRRTSQRRSPPVLSPPTSPFPPPLCGRGGTIFPALLPSPLRPLGGRTLYSDRTICYARPHWLRREAPDESAAAIGRLSPAMRQNWSGPCEERKGGDEEAGEGGEQPNWEGSGVGQQTGQGSGGLGVLRA